MVCIRPIVVLATLLPCLAGCPVTQSQDTPVDPLRQRAAGGERYWLYVPSYYTSDRAWPLVVTLHGMHGFDTANAQIREWRALAEQHGFVVVSPSLESPSGFLSLSRSLRRGALEDDEEAVLAVLADIRRQYRIDDRAVLLTGFSSGGYPMYFIGLRHPDQFTAMAARAANVDVETLDGIELTDAARRMPAVIIHGEDDFELIREHSWAAFRWLRQHGLRDTGREEVPGGHLRQPRAAWEWWRQHLPREYR